MTQEKETPTPDMLRNFFDAVENGELDAVRRTIEQYPGAVNWEKEGMAPLQLAIAEAYQGATHRAVALHLIDKGADPDKIAQGVPMVDLACAENEPELAIRMIEAGADITWKTPPTDEPMIAGRSTMLMFATGWGHPSVAKCLLDHGADVNERDEYGNTALMEAAHAGKPAVAELLIARGADLTLRNKDGDDALSIAKKDKRQWALPVIQEAFTRFALREARRVPHAGIDRDIKVRRNPLKIRFGNG